MEQLALFHKRYFLALVRRAMFKNHLSSEDAHDVVQDTFVLAASKLRNDGNPNAWLRNVVDKLSINLVRTRCRRIATRWGLGIEHVPELKGTHETDD